MVVLRSAIIALISIQQLAVLANPIARSNDIVRRQFEDGYDDSGPDYDQPYNTAGYLNQPNIPSGQSGSQVYNIPQPKARPPKPASPKATAAPAPAKPVAIKQPLQPASPKATAAPAPAKPAAIKQPLQPATPQTSPTPKIVAISESITATIATDVTMCRPWPNSAIQATTAKKLYKYTDVTVTCWSKTNVGTDASGEIMPDATDTYLRTGLQGCYINENDLKQKNDWEAVLRPCVVIGARPLDPNPGPAAQAQPKALQVPAAIASPTQPKVSQAPAAIAVAPSPSPTSWLASWFAPAKPAPAKPAPVVPVPIVVAAPKPQVINSQHDGHFMRGGKAFSREGASSAATTLLPSARPIPASTAVPTLAPKPVYKPSPAYPSRPVYPPNPIYGPGGPDGGDSDVDAYDRRKTHRTAGMPPARPTTLAAGLW